ncbi:MAG: hypothetical protein NW217_16415 [Hyphomicrobiaceae bacterium]|nr:hypothetical protein [Hyphomicrobiaceae bacterium]
MNRDIFLAILSMDTYHRGYNAGLTSNGLGIGASDWQLIIGNQVGNATISNVAADSDAEEIGFYAAAYSWNGETVIAYRGTDDDFAILTASSDVWNGYGIGIGRPTGPQAEAAIDFYQSVAANVSPSSVTATGHSLGGGLAGFVGALYGLDTTLFANMNFELAAQNAYGLSVYGQSGYQSHPLDPIGPDYFDIEPLRELIYGTSTPWAPSFQLINSYAVSEEALAATRSPIPAYETRFDPHATWSDIDPISRHYLPPTILMMYASLASGEGGPESSEWQRVMPEVWRALVDDQIGSAVGAGPGTGDERFSPGQQMQVTIAYSALDEGERPFGDTGIRALFEDASNLGAALALESKSSLLVDSAPQLARILTQFAGQLSLRDVEQANAPDAISGVLSLSQDQQTLGVDFADALWKLGDASGQTPVIVGRDDLLFEVLQTSGQFGTDGQPTNDIGLGMLWLWNTPDSRVIDRIVFQTTNAPVNTTLPERNGQATINLPAGQTPVSIFAAADGNDVVIGAATTAGRRELKRRSATKMRRD